MSNTPNQPPSDRGNSAADPSQSGDDALEVDIQIDEDSDCPLSEPECRRAIFAAAGQRDIRAGSIGLRVCGDAEIQLLNVRHLNHDYPTDVISFTYELEPNYVSGELVVSVDTARRRTEELGWSDRSELMLYIVHGVLHLTGLNDKSDAQRREMRDHEQQVMRSLGVSDIDQFHADRPRIDSSEAQ